MKKLSFFFCLLFIGVSCQNTDLDPASVIGTFQLINDPVRCALPTSHTVQIVPSGSQFKITYDYFGKQGQTIEGVSMEKTDTETKLYYKGTEIGNYLKDKYTDWDGKNFTNAEGMVLYLHYYDQGTKEHLAFMGKK